MRLPALPAALLLLGAAWAPPGLHASTRVPAVLEQPGTEPGQTTLETAVSCRQCHGDYDPAREPYRTWQGSMMANAARDPLLWAALAVAEQDLVATTEAWTRWGLGAPPETGGAGDLCLRCHSPSAWLDDRSTPTDGSALRPEDYEGVGCDLCHRLVDPASLEAEFLVRPGREPWKDLGGGRREGFYGSGQYVVDLGLDKRTPHDNAPALHGAIPSEYMRDGNLCGTCHDVSNPAVAELAPGSGRQDGVPLPPGAAFAEPPYAYGIVERTWSEWKASALDTWLTAGFADLPLELRAPGGALRWAAGHAPYSSSWSEPFNPPRAYTCQSCHMPPDTGAGASGPVMLRPDHAIHDLTGGSTWVPEAILWLSDRGLLRGGPVAPDHAQALRDGIVRARATLRRAASLEAKTAPGGVDLAVRVVNLTGHKLPSGYPEGRRVWLNVRFYDGAGGLVAERGAYDGATASLSRDTRIYEARPGITAAWAARLVADGYDPAMPLGFLPDGTVEHTLGELASGSLGSALETFHFALNDTLLEDRRIPPFGMDAAEAATRQIVPVPAGAYPVLPGGVYAHYDDVSFPIPAAATRAEVRLYYQSASREYVRFLRFANRTNAAGQVLEQAWAATGMSPPEEMAFARWERCAGPPGPVAALLAVKRDSGGVELGWAGPPGALSYRIHRHATRDRSGAPYTEVAPGSPALLDRLPPGTHYLEVRAWNGCGEGP